MLNEYLSSQRGRTINRTGQLLLFNEHFLTWATWGRANANYFVTKSMRHLVVMPRTKSSKKNDTRTPLQKLNKIECKVELLMFFHYYDGLTTDGALGCHVTPKIPFGSTSHRTGIFEIAYTKDQFRSKAKKIGQIAQQFIDSDSQPPEELRPTISPEEIQSLREQGKDMRSPAEKFQTITEELELFVFFKYYDAYSTDGEIGFHLRAGPPGSVNHKRAYLSVLEPWSDSKFREKGKAIAKIAKEFADTGSVPPANRRPGEPERQVPWGLIQTATALDGNYYV
jgi:hypothetical protein